MLQSPGHGHFQADCPNGRALTIKEIEEIDHIHLEISEKDEEMGDEATVLASNIGECLILKRSLHIMESYKEKNKREHIFTYGVPSKAKLLVGGVVLTLPPYIRSRN